MRAPHPGRDYPRTTRDFYREFVTDDDCWEWLDHLRWGSTDCKHKNGNRHAPHFVCPECGCEESWVIEHGRRCKKCRHRISALAGTPFHHTHIELPKMLEAAWLLTERSSALSTLGFEGSTRMSYENAWTVLHKYREVMHAEMLSLELHGLVEVDEVFVGGKPRKPRTGMPKGKHRAHKKEPVLVMVEKRSNGRVVYHRLQKTGARDIIPVVTTVVECPSTILTDAKRSYNSLARRGYRHRVYNMKQLPGQAHQYMPVVHGVASNMQSWMIATLHRYPKPKHLDYYLAEQAFRYNHRGVRNPGLLFYRLMEATVNHDALTMRSIVSHPT